MKLIKNFLSFIPIFERVLKSEVVPGSERERGVGEFESRGSG